MIIKSLKIDINLHYVTDPLLLIKGITVVDKDFKKHWTDLAVVRREYFSNTLLSSILIEMPALCTAEGFSMVLKNTTK